MNLNLINKKWNIIIFTIFILLSVRCKTFPESIQSKIMDWDTTKDLDFKANACISFLNGNSENIDILMQKLSDENKIRLKKILSLV